MNIVSFIPAFSDPEDVVRKFCARSFKVPYSLELVYLPFVLFKYHVRLTQFFGKTRIKEGLFLVDMAQGIPVNIKTETFFEVEETLKKYFGALLPPLQPEDKKKARTVALEGRDVSEEQVLPPILNESEAIGRGKTLLRYDLMRLAGNLRYRMFEIIPSSETKVLYYPYWIVYYRSGQGEMKFGIIDGLSGQKESGEIVTSIKMSLARKHSNNLGLNFSREENRN